MLHARNSLYTVRARWHHYILRTQWGRHLIDIIRRMCTREWWYCVAMCMCDVEFGRLWVLRISFFWWCYLLVLRGDDCEVVCFRFVRVITVGYTEGWSGSNQWPLNSKTSNILLSRRLAQFSVLRNSLYAVYAGWHYYILYFWDNGDYYIFSGAIFWHN